MSDDLIQRLLFAEKNFLVALENGPQLLGPYRETLSNLPNALSTATKTGGAGNETVSLAHSVASRILNIASCYLHVKHQEEVFSAQLHTDCDAMLHQMDALNLDAPPKSSHSPDTHFPVLSPTPALEIGCSHPAFPASAYQWLLENLHNPYPSAEVKAQIAVNSSCQVSSINSWFINARRRIGWTTLCRERFSNCRTDMIDAACRALVEEDPRRTLSPEIRHSFVAMKVAAEGLYSSTASRSAFAGDLDAIVKDMKEGDKQSMKAGGCRQAEQGNYTKAVQDPRPSPDRSNTASPVPALDPSLTDESEEDEDVAPPVIAGSKRCRSSIEPPNQQSAGRPVKRLRASMACQASLLSPPSSTDCTNEPSGHGLPEFPPVYSTRPETNDVLPSCKRRLSDADDTGMRKRPCGSVVASHPHIVSDPLPRSNMENEFFIDDWFNANFDALFAIPPPVDATEPDFSASWEVELFKDYNIPGISNHALKYPPAPTADTQISAPTNFSDFDSLLQSIGSNTFITPPESVPPYKVTEAAHAISLDSSIPGISQTSTNWTSLLDSTDQPTTFPQYPIDPQSLPEIDLTMLQFPLVETVNTEQGFASKLHQLHVMQEAVRRMEQELQAEGIVI